MKRCPIRGNSSIPPSEHQRYEHLFAAFSDRHFDRAIEVGCAEGFFTPRLAEVADEVVGLDVSEVALQRAGRAGGTDSRLRFVRHDVSEGPLDPPPYDLIVASEVLYFFKEPAVLTQVADRLVSALAPGGWLVLSHMRLLKDMIRHRRTVSGYPRMGAASVHPVFKSHPHLCLVRENLQPLYAICVLERGRGDRGA